MSGDFLKKGILGKSKISVGRYTYGFENISIRQWDEGAALKIGAFCSLADNIKIFLGGNHRTDWITTYPFGHVYKNDFGEACVSGHPATKGDVVVGNDVWIGSGATVMSGVNIGDGAVVSANAFVVKDVPSYHIVGGNPAKIIKRRFNEDVVDLLLRLRWWDLPISDINKITRILCASPDKDVLLKLVLTYR